MWSPSGTQLAYASVLPSPWFLGALLGARRRLGAHTNHERGLPEQAAELVAERVLDRVRPHCRLETLRSTSFAPTGLTLHRVVDFSGSDAPASLPGRRTAPRSSIRTMSTVGMYALPPQVSEIFVANADGSGERRLTELAPQFAYDSAPTWSPDGDQILFNRRYQLTGGALTTMNPDGTCESGLSADPRGMPSSLESPSWQTIPGGAAIGPKTCRAVALEPMTPHQGRPSSCRRRHDLERGHGGAVERGGHDRSHCGPISAWKRTDGYACTRRSASFVCRIERLDRGQSQFVGVLGTARRVGRDRRSRNVSLSARLTVTADGPLLPTRRDTGDVFFTPSRCVTTDRGGGYIEGTRFPWTGSAVVVGRTRSTLWAGRTTCSPAPARDVINSWDSRGDVISCGPGRDRVFADRKDKVSRDCERVRRGYLVVPRLALIVVILAAVVAGAVSPPPLPEQPGFDAPQISPERQLAAVSALLQRRLEVHPLGHDAPHRTG